MRREVAIERKCVVVVDDSPAPDGLTLGLHGAAYGVIARLTTDEADKLADALREVAANVRL